MCNQIHVPLQSGSSDILSKMHRGYNKEKFLQKVDMIRGIIPNVSLTTDIIVGFPGETDDDFQDTMDIVKYVEFDSVYMFQFSPRPGTRAYDMEDEYVDQDIIKKRFQIAKKLNEFFLRHSKVFSLQNTPVNSIPSYYFLTIEIMPFIVPS